MAREAVREQFRQLRVGLARPLRWPFGEIERSRTGRESQHRRTVFRSITTVAGCAGFVFGNSPEATSRKAERPHRSSRTHAEQWVRRQLGRRPAECARSTLPTHRTGRVQPTFEIVQRRSRPILRDRCEPALRQAVGGFERQPPVEVVAHVVFAARRWVNYLGGDIPDAPCSPRAIVEIPKCHACSRGRRRAMYRLFSGRRPLAC